MSDTHTIASAGRALRSGDVTSVELTEQALAAAALTEADVHAYLTIEHDRALAAASAADEKIAAGHPGPLVGIPIALKDNMVTKGIPTTASSQILDGWVPPYSGTAVSRALDAGAILVGKTNLDEFAMGSSTENSAYGPTRNPWDTSRVPGGSSGGSAAAVAAGSALGAYGSDTGGSIRQPAAFCGLVGMKPTYGLVSRFGLIAFASSLDQIGPFAWTVEDAALLLDAVAGHDPLDSTSYPGDAPVFASKLEDGVDGLRIGVVDELSGAGIDEPVAQAFQTTLDRLADAGAQIGNVSLPASEAALSVYYLIAPAECSANLARFDGVRYGLRREGATVEEMMRRTRAEGFGPEVTRRILLGTYALSAGYYDAFYGQAQRVRTLTIREFDRAFQDFDVLVSPTTPTTAFGFGDKTQDPLSMYLSDVCTIPANLAGLPAVSVPVGADGDGLPIGFQVMGRALQDDVVLQVAAAIERTADPIGRPEFQVVAT